jgi:cell division protein FtsL
MSTLQETFTPRLTRPRPQRRLRPATPVRRRRSRWHPPPARVRMPAVTARIDRHLRIYAAGAVLLVLVLLYLVQAAQVTAQSYRIEQLQAQQQGLAAEQAQLRYEEASLQAPARVQSEASRTGMQRAAPTAYVPFKAVAVNLLAPVDAPPANEQPLWTRLLASFWR